MPAAQLLRAALVKQQTLLAEERQLWQQSNRLLAHEDEANDIDRTLGLESRAFFLESTFKDQINPKRQTAGPQWGSPELDLAS